MTEMMPRFESAIEVREAIEDAQHDLNRKAVIVEAGKRAKMPTPIINEKIVEKLLAEYRLADLVDQGQAAGWIAMAEDGRRKYSESEDILTLADLGVEAPRLHEYRTLRDRWTPDALRQQAEIKSDADEWLSRNGLLSPGGGAHVGNNSGDNEWYTPAEYIKAARAVMDVIDLDPASSDEANAVVGATTYYTEEQNGLTRPWGGRVWMNPPYARPLIDHFCDRLADTYGSGDVLQACVLVNNATETGWFHCLAEVAGAMCFPRHRVKFWHPRKEATPLQGQAVIYLGPEIERFRAEFVRFGFTVVL